MGYPMRQLKFLLAAFLFAGAAQAQTLGSPNVASVIFHGSTSGASTVTAPATGGGPLALPPGTDMLVSELATQTLSNKSIAASEINSGTLAIATGGTNASTAAAAMSNLLGNPAAGTYSVECSSGTICATIPSTVFNPGGVTITGGTITGTPISGSTGSFSTLNSTTDTATNFTATGSAIVPTMAAGTDTTAAASTAFVTNAISTIPESTPGLIGVKTFTTSGTYTPDAGTVSAIVEEVGGGGGSGGLDIATNIASGGGASASYAKVYIPTVTAETVTVGAAGTAGTAGGTSGGTGGTTNFGSLVVCPGGSGSTGSSTSTYNPGAQPAACTITGPTTILSVRGSAGGADTSGPTAGTGASGPLGFGGPVPNGNAAGIAATGYGAGAGGATSNSSQLAGAVGSPGIIIVYEYN